MGGLGSGRRDYATTPRVDQSLQLDANNITDAVDHPGAIGRKVWGDEDDPTAELKIHFEGVDEETDRVTHLRLEYTITDRWSDTWSGEETHPVAVEYTDCHFGSVRPWFRCPGVFDGEPCSRRVRKLHFPRGAKYWLCRECYDLQYLTSRCSGDDVKTAELQYRRAFAKADAESRRPHPNGEPWLPDRPKGMHYDTFEKLVDAARDADREYQRQSMEQLRQMARKLSLDVPVTNG